MYKLMDTLREIEDLLGSDDTLQTGFYNSTYFKSCKVDKSSNDRKDWYIELGYEEHPGKIKIYLEYAEGAYDTIQYLLGNGTEVYFNESEQVLKDVVEVSDEYCSIYCTDIAKECNEIDVWLGDLCITTNTSLIREKSLYQLVMEIMCLK